MTGDEEISEYKGKGFEQVLMLNYQSLGYLLQGDRRAYNVARRAMDWQEQEERKFQERLEESRKEAEEKGLDAAAGDQSPFDVVGTAEAEYARFEERASQVRSAYVNPFAWYVAGMVQELDSYQDASLRSNAYQAYKKALELNPDSQVIKDAVDEYGKEGASGAGGKLLHVLVAEGFAPEKKVLVSGIQTSKGPISIQLPIYEPVEGRVARIEVRTAGKKGKRVATLSTIADVEAIALRHQKDSAPLHYLGVMLAMVRSGLENQALAKAGDIWKVIGALRQEMTAPDTRSWMSLPATIQGARIRLTSKMKALELVAYDERGKVVGRSAFTVDPAKHGFVYARSIDDKLYVQAAPRLWID